LICHEGGMRAQINLYPRSSVCEDQNHRSALFV
jgi:hypothetical protein